MTTTLPLIVPSLTPTSSPSRKSNTYNENSLLTLNNNQNTTPLSSFLNTNKAPITPDSCSSSSFTNKLPKIKLILKLPSSSTSPKERPANTASLLHKPINITSSASSSNIMNKRSMNSSSQTVLMIDEIMNTIFDTTEILLRSKNGNSQNKSKKYSNEIPKAKVKNTKLRRIRTTSNKIKKTAIKNGPVKRTTKKKQISKEIETKNLTSSSDINTIVLNAQSETEAKYKDESEKKIIKPLTYSDLPNEKSINSSAKLLENNEHSLPIMETPNSSFKLKKIKFIYNPSNDKSNTVTDKDDTNITTDNGKRKRRSGNQKEASPKKKREVINTFNDCNSNSNSNLYTTEEEISSSIVHPIIHLKVSNNDNNDIVNNNGNESKQKKKGKKRTSPTKKTNKITKSKKANETIIPINQKSPPQRSPKQQPQTKSYQMPKIECKNINENYTNSSSPSLKPTFKLNLSYTPSYINNNDNSRFNSYLSSFKHKSSVVHSPSPLTNSFTIDQSQTSINNNEYTPSKLGISSTYDPNRYKIKTQISPTNQILNKNIWKNKNGNSSITNNITKTKKDKISIIDVFKRKSQVFTSSSKKEKISIIDALKRESQLFTSSSKKIHSKSSVSSYYSKPSLRRYSSFVDEAKVKPLSIQSNISNASSIISTKSIISSPYHDNSKYKSSLNSYNNSSTDIKDIYTPNYRVKSFSTPASPKNLSEDSLRSKAHSYIQRSLTSCKSLTEKFEFSSILGYGSNGVVLGAKRRSDNLEVAIKYIYKTPSSKICEEVNILKEISPHPSIIRYIDSFEDNNCIYLVTEKSGSSWVPSEDSNQILTCESSNTGNIVLYSTTCNTSSLFDYIELNGCVPPPEQKRMFKAIAEAVYALHSRNIVHGDIKEENILIDSHHNPKLCDFGHARHIGNNTPPHFAVYGTLELSAPELMPNLNVPAHLTKSHVVKRYNGMAQDIWALGLVLYTMTHGELPLNHSKIISKEIDLTSNKYKEYPCTYNCNLSKDCIHLIKRMLTVDMKKRATIKEIINHPWLKKK